MRALLLTVAAAALSVTGCGKKQAADNSSAPGETVSADDVSTNDTTVIDAATGADANMAMDVDINQVENGDAGDAHASTDTVHTTPRAAAAPTGESVPNTVEPARPPAQSNAN